MRKRSKKWLLNKLLAESGRLQFTLFPLFEKKEKDLDVFIGKLIAFIENNKFIIIRTQYSSLPKIHKKELIAKLTLTNCHVIKALMTFCQESTQYKSLNTDNLSVIPDYLSCTEVDDLEDFQKYVSNINSRYIGTILASNQVDPKKHQDLVIAGDILKKLNMYIKYDV